MSNEGLAFIVFSVGMLTLMGIGMNMNMDLWNETQKELARIRGTK